ncbi:MAG TPA: plasmid pRiA4b ORF-3 family protein [Candidatus Didemnitutus sp.]|nr:plasmid pRiA4b ORF-3 family protein [Candidatus Didemnitutus sp.]
MPLTASHIAILRISLNNIEPEIWRVFTVPAKIDLAELHLVLQHVMGWKNVHPHEWEVDEKGGSLRKVAASLGDTFNYSYDPKEKWDHTVEVVATGPLSTFLQPFKVLDGEGACPPEDVGGAKGFEKFCAVMADTKHPKYAEQRAWYGGTFYRDAYNRSAAQKKLDELR